MAIFDDINVYPLFERKGACTPQYPTRRFSSQKPVDRIYYYTWIGQNSRVRHYSFEPIDGTAVGFVDINIYMCVCMYVSIYN